MTIDQQELFTPEHLAKMQFSHTAGQRRSGVTTEHPSVAADPYTAQIAAKGPRIALKPYQAEKVAESGEYRSMHASGYSNGNGGPTPGSPYERHRIRAERDYGFDKPVYGHLPEGPSEVQDHYGEVTLELKHHRWKDTTAIAGDSLNQHGEAVEALSGALPTAHSLSDLMHGRAQIEGEGWEGYTETQTSTHGTGRIPLSDFSRASVPGGEGRFERREYNGVSAALEGAGVPVQRISRTHQAYLPGMEDPKWGGVGSEDVGLDWAKGGDLVESNRDHQRRTSVL